MSDLNTMIAELSHIEKNPAEQLKAWTASGKKAIGVGPYYCPEEIVYAAGMLPFGVWGSNGTLAQAKQYFPPFYCSIAQRTLEMGMSGILDGLSAMMITTLCDTLKPLSQNWKLGVPHIPAIVVSQPQNRKGEAGRAYAKASYTEVKEKIEEIAGAPISDDKLQEAIALYNEWRGAMRAFVKAVSKNPSAIKPSERSSVINASYFMDKKVHTEKIKALTALLEEAASEGSEHSGPAVVVSGIHTDLPGLLAVFDDFGLAIVADDVAKESRTWAYDAPMNGDPLTALADQYCSIDNCSVLFDADKDRAGYLVELAQSNNADGVVIVQAKFCDPEEFDVPIVRAALSAAQIPSVVIEVDQQMEAFEQAHTAIQAFVELIDNQ